MTPGIYKVSFTSNQQLFGEGLALFEDGRIHGGDAQYLFLGRYNLGGNTVTAEVTVRHYQGQPISIFGTQKEFKLSVAGKVTGSDFRVQGHVVGQPQLTIQIAGTKIADAVS